MYRLKALLKGAAFCGVLMAWFVGGVKEGRAERYLNLYESAGISLHKPNWLMVGSLTDEYRNDEAEVVFQVSLKKEILIPNLFVAYTQKSFWQAFNTKRSSPFRETNYNPELFYRIKTENSFAR